MTPTWLEVLAWICLGLGVLSAAMVAVDIGLAGYRQTMWIMNGVWPITALYFGPVGIWGYLKLGRPLSYRATTGTPDGAAWHSGALSASHCGAGCVLGDIIGGWLVFLTGWTLFGERMYLEFLLEFALAWVFGIAFQYFAIKLPTLSAPRALASAIKADTLSILAYEVGMFAWMAVITMLVLGELPINDPVFWFVMQLGMVVGFFTTYPANQWLVRAGIKHAM